ncbi:MAG: DUF2971 domain-containing protein [Bacteroidota bacterium]
MEQNKAKRRIEEIVEEIYEIFKIQIENTSKGQSIDGTLNDESIKWAYFHLYIPSQNATLINSPYFYNNGVVHFTDIKSLKSIIGTQTIRLYNLHHLDDPREFLFAGDLFALKDEEKEDARDNFFIMSFCEAKILQTKEISKEFNLWRLYGENGEGVAIIFSILNDPVDWFEFHISKIIYGAKNRKNFKSLYQMIKELKEEFSVDVDVRKLCTFHKSRIYNIEKEVRILWDRRKMRAGRKDRTIHDYNNQQIFPVVQKKEDSPVQFLSLPIYYYDQNFQERGIPLLRIDEIILGYKHKYNQSLKNEIEELAKTHLGYGPKVSFSRLVKPYWGKNIS